MQTKNIFITAAVIVALLATGAESQIVYQQPASSILKFHYNNWSLDVPGGEKTVISQYTFAFSGFLPLRDNFEARYYLASGSNNLDMGSEEADISGLGDLRIQLSHSFVKDQVLLSAGVNLPTGKRKLDPVDERAIIEFLSYDFLSLPMRRYGEGLGFNLQAGGAKEIGSFKYGVSAIYDYCGTYQPYSGSGDYDPGDAFTLAGTANTRIGKITYSADAGFSLFTTDQLDDEDIYKQAPQFNARLMAVRPFEKYTGTIGVRMIIRGRNKRYSLSDGVIESQLKKYGDEFDSFLRLAYNLGKGTSLAGIAGMRQIMTSEEYLGKSSIYHFGVDFNRNLSERFNLDLGLIYHMGSTELDDIDIRGLQIAGGIRFAY
ncbi:MAG: hypothetical protein JW814_05915 [Candidatus Krumholzibacteriota bacterium]|nr:hypothetical protein [Candidatus Krumholzibacteriota bacterium]